MEKHFRIADIMTENVTTITHDATLMDAIHLIKKHRIRHLPVVDGKKVVGIITSNDIDRLTFGGLFDDGNITDDPVLDMLTIPQVMTSNPHTVTPNDSIKEAAEIFVQKKYHALVVVEGEKVAGIVTTTDMIRYLLEEILQD